MLKKKKEEENRGWGLAECACAYCVEGWLHSRQPSWIKPRYSLRSDSSHAYEVAVKFWHGMWNKSLTFPWWKGSVGQDSSPTLSRSHRKMMWEWSHIVWDCANTKKKSKMLIITGSSGKGALNSLLEASNPNYFLRNKPQRQRNDGEWQVIWR